MWQTPCLVVSCGTWFWTKFQLSQAYSWLYPILQGLRWMKVWNNKDSGVNGHRCRLPTCRSICVMPCVLLTETALWMKNSPWMGLRKCQGLMRQHLPCCTTYPRAFAPWNSHLVSILCEVTSGPANTDFGMWLQSEPGQHHVARRSSKFDSWSKFQSEPGQCDMASKPSKFDFWTKLQSEPGQRDMASRPSKPDIWTKI